MLHCGGVGQGKIEKNQTEADFFFWMAASYLAGSCLALSYLAASCLAINLVI